MLFYREVEVVKQTDEWKGGADSDEEQVQPEWCGISLELLVVVLVKYKNLSRWMYIYIYIYITIEILELLSPT